MTLYDFNLNAQDNIEKEFPKSLIGWYDFKRGGSALFISGGDKEGEILKEVLSDAGLKVEVMRLEELAKKQGNSINVLNRKKESFDYIVGFGIIERHSTPIKLLTILKDMLEDDGHILIGTDNRLAMRYFCGDKDKFTGECFDGIDNYISSEYFGKREKDRAYSKKELENMLDEAGILNRRFYTVMPVLENPRLLFAEDYLPEEELDIRVTPQYRSPETVFLEEERMYKTLADNGLFHILANGYLIETGRELPNVKAVTSSLDRGRELAIYTIIGRDNKVYKKAAYPEGKKRISELETNNNYLNQRGIKTVVGEYENDTCVMPYIKAPTATEYFRRLLIENRELFYKELDRWMDIVEASSEHIPYEEVDWDKFDPNWQKRKPDDPNRDKWKKLAFGNEAERRGIGPVLKNGYIDLVCLNCFVTGDGFVFYDQEFVFEALPANVIKVRTIDLICNADTEKILKREEIFERYGLLRHLLLWRQYEGLFLTRLRLRDKLSEYYMSVQRDGQTAAINRNRINYPEIEYERIFRDVFDGISGKKLYVFGSGRFAELFFSRYSQSFEIEAIIDNNTEKQGTEICGYMVNSPDVLEKKAFDDIKIIICIKKYQDVIKQLEALGIKNYSVYNPDADYRVRNIALGKRESAPISEAAAASKKYHIGYVSGVFDIFHIGHLNLLRRAKEQCDYLIVGVVTDEQVVNGKKTSPHMSFEERLEIVKACRYVDEAVRIPPEHPDTREAYLRYHFDVQFSGSDYENDPSWLVNREWLRQRGSELIFFPYTGGVSSTQLKEHLSVDEKADE